MKNLTNEELEKVYLVLKAFDKGQLVNKNEEWEEDVYGERLVDGKGVKVILRKIFFECQNSTSF